MGCKTLTITETGDGGAAPLSVTADKVKGTFPYTANVTIKGDPGKKVNLTLKQFASFDRCFLDDITLDSTGQTIIPIEVSQKITIYALSGWGCCAYGGSGCEKSNELTFDAAGEQTFFEKYLFEIITGVLIMVIGSYIFLKVR